MPTAAWKKAASQTDRRPVLHLAVESVKTIKRFVSGSGWNSLPASSHIAVDNGVVSAETRSYSGSSFAGDVSLYPDIDGYIDGFTVDNLNLQIATYFPLLPAGSSVVVALHFTLNGAPHTATGNFTTDSDSQPFITVTAEYGKIFRLPATLRITAGDQLVMTGMTSSQCLPEFSVANGWSLVPFALTAEVQSSLATLQTPVLDLGSVPTVPSVFSAEDDVPGSCTLNFEAWGSNDKSIWSPIGIVEDGASLAPYRYYYIVVTFTTVVVASATLTSLGVSGGDDQFLHFSTHEDLPVKGAKPYLSMNIGALNSKLELMKLGSTGEVAPHLIYLEDTFEMIRDGDLRNKAACLRLGFVGLAEADYEPLFTGLWYDYAVDLYKADLAVKTRTIISRFQKVQLPKEINVSGGTRDDASCPVIEWIDENMISVMLDIIDLMEIQDRYIDRASFNTLTAPGASRSGIDWNVSRRLDKDNKEDAVKLLEELSVLSGVFLLQLPDGRLRASLYDPAASIVMEIEAGEATFGIVDGGQADLYTRQQICYGQRHEGDLETGADRGSWVIGQDVSRNDSMTVSGVTWYCIQSHHTSLDTLPGLGALYRAYWATEWSTRNYLAGEVCLRNGPLYTCIVSHTADTATEPGAGVSWRSKWSCKPTKNGSGASDFYNVLTLINPEAEKAWGLKLDPLNASATDGPGYQKQFLEKWNATPAAREALAERMDAWFANPKLKLKASNLPPQMWSGENDVELLGSMVGVTGLMLPVSGAVWGQPCSKKKFFVLGKTLDPAKCTVALDLLEV